MATTHGDNLWPPKWVLLLNNNKQSQYQVQKGRKGTLSVPYWDKEGHSVIWSSSGKMRPWDKNANSNNSKEYKVTLFVFLLIRSWYPPQFNAEADDDTTAQITIPCPFKCHLLPPPSREDSNKNIQRSPAHKGWSAIKDRDTLPFLSIQFHLPMEMPNIYLCLTFRTNNKYSQRVSVGGVEKWEVGAAPKQPTQCA